MSSSVSRPSRLYLHTPLADLLRGRLPGRLDWKSRLARTELPESIRVTITSVVRRTRLNRLEKSEVCEELIAHFEDGLRAGETGANLLDQFGNPMNAAILIRRGKIRNRNMFAKFVRLAGYFSLATLVVYGAVSIYFFAGQPNPSTNYLVALNKVAEAQNEGDKAWPIYREAWIRHNVTQKQMTEIFRSSNSDEVRSGELVRAGDSEWDAAVAYLTQRTDLLNSIREAARKPVLGLALEADIDNFDPRDLQALFPNRVHGDEEARENNTPASELSVYERFEKESIINVLLPHVSTFRSLANLLKVDTRLAIEQKDSKRAVENILSTFRVAEHASEFPVLVCGLVGLAVTDIGLDQIEEVTAEDGFLSEKQLIELQTAVHELPLREFVNLEGERAMMYDILQRVYTDDGNGNGRMTYEGIEILQYLQAAYGNATSSRPNDPATRIMAKVLGPASLFAIASRQEMREQYDKLMNEAELAFDKPIAVYESSVDDYLQNLSEADRVKFSLLDQIFPAIRSVRVAMETRMARRDATELALAVLRFHAQRGDWPVSIGELAPDFLDSIPTDPLNAEPLKWKVTNENTLNVYSVGNNGTDDHGRPMMDKKTGETIASGQFKFQKYESVPYDGDWVLWPQWNH